MYRLAEDFGQVSAIIHSTYNNMRIQLKNVGAYATAELLDWYRVIAPTIRGTKTKQWLVRGGGARARPSTTYGAYRGEGGSEEDK